MCPYHERIAARAARYVHPDIAQRIRDDIRDHACGSKWCQPKEGQG